ncbi:MAG: ABC transporter substrate-binding protein [Chloroflexi bacterium]|nr:ABC transporter substrate-binding protein [Chloroflexota bacterium]
MQTNTMGGLYHLNSDNQVTPLLASGPPQVSADGLEVTIPLRLGLHFPDGTDFTADDVVWSINRAKFGRGGYLVNRFLKDADEDGYGDVDAVQALTPESVIIRLKAPTAYLPAVLATPPFFPISSDCYAAAEDLNSVCGGLGPYTIVSREADAIRLTANPEWPGEPPAFENIKVRFFNSVADLRVSLEEFNSVDIAWSGLPYADYEVLRAVDGFESWASSGVFKSYLIFEQSQPPWNKRQFTRGGGPVVGSGGIGWKQCLGRSGCPFTVRFQTPCPATSLPLPQRDLSRAQFLLQGEATRPPIR